MNRLFLPVGALVLALLIGVGAVVARAKEPHGSPGRCGRKRNDRLDRYGGDLYRFRWTRKS